MPDPARPEPSAPAGASLPDPAAALALIKPAVRAQPAYTLRHRPAARKLNQNEAPCDFPAELKHAVLARAAAAQWQRYPEFVPAQLQERLAARYGWRPDGVLVGNGSNELIQATLAVTVGPGDAVVAPSPTFSLYRLLTSVMGGRYVPVPLGHDFRYDVGGLIDAAVRERARVVVLNSPNNPTGSALPEGAVEDILTSTDALVVCDEAYQEFGGPSAIPLLGGHPRLVVLRTFSKAMGLAGLRCGLALAHPVVARELAKAKLPYNVNLVTVIAAEVALEHAELLDARTLETAGLRDQTLMRLRELPGIEAFDSAANFILVRFGAVPSRVVFDRLLDDYSILVRDMSGYPELSNCLRISIGTADDMEAVVHALGSILTSGQEHPDDARR